MDSMNEVEKKIETEIKKLRARLDKLENSARSSKEEFQEFNGHMWSNSIGEDLTFDQAKEFAKNCRDGGFSDWRVPTAKEIADTIDWEKGTSAISRGAFGFYWSSTQSTTTYGWYLNFSSSYSLMYSSYKACGFSVRCLRDLEVK